MSADARNTASLSQDLLDLLQWLGPRVKHHGSESSLAGILVSTEVALLEAMRPKLEQMVDNAADQCNGNATDTEDLTSLFYILHTHLDLVGQYWRSQMSMWPLFCSLLDRYWSRLPDESRNETRASAGMQYATALALEMGGAVCENDNLFRV